MSDIWAIARFDLDGLKWDGRRYRRRRFQLRATGEFRGGRAEVERLKAETGKLVGRFRETISSFAPVNFRVNFVAFCFYFVLLTESSVGFDELGILVICRSDKLIW